jgi:hypothetical protein
MCDKAVFDPFDSDPTRISLGCSPGPTCRKAYSFDCSRARRRTMRRPRVYPRIALAQLLYLFSFCALCIHSLFFGPRRPSAMRRHDTFFSSPSLPHDHQCPGQKNHHPVYDFFFPLGKNTRLLLRLLQRSRLHQRSNL